MRRYKYTLMMVAVLLALIGAFVWRFAAGCEPDYVGHRVVEWECS